jgi:hypothetical protein
VDPAISSRRCGRSAAMNAIPLAGLTVGFHTPMRQAKPIGTIYIFKLNYYPDSRYK